MLSISTFEADMLNFFDEDDNFIKPANADKFSAGEYLSMISNVLGTNYIIPFSSIHEYQREDSIWVNKYIYPIEKYHEDISSKHTYIKPFSFINSKKDDHFININIKKKKLEIKSADSFGDNWKDELNIHDKKIIEDYFNKFSSFREKIGFIFFIIGGKEHNLKFNGPKNKGISFELPRNSLLKACKYNIFDDLLIGNFMKTKLYNLRSLYDPSANFSNEVCKIGDNGRAYSKEELHKYRKYYAKKMGKEYFLNLFANASREQFIYFFKNYRNSKYYQKVKKIYYYLFK